MVEEISELIPMPRPGVSFNDYGNTEVKATKDSYVMRITMPGVEKDNLEVSIDEDYLRIKADTKVEDKKEDERFFTRRIGEFHYDRLFQLPEGIEANDITSVYKDGMLTITVPRPKEEPKPESKKIDIKYEG
jgi:HSP20 family protein